MLLGRLKQIAASDRFWMMSATMAARGASFLVGLVLTRTQGVAVLGIYAATLNVAASAVSPLAQVLQNNAAILAAQHADAPSRVRLVDVHRPVLWALLVFGLLVFALLAPASGLHAMDLDQGWLVFAAAACVIYYQLFNAVAQGLLQGVGYFGHPARWLTLLAAGTAAVTWPFISLGGLAGAYAVLALNSVLPPVLLLALYVRQPAGVVCAPPTQQGSPLSPRSVWAALTRSAPFVMTALFTAGVSWFCFVFLANRMQGAEGLGWVSLGIQWGTLMLVPCTSWGGVTMKRLLDAFHAHGRFGMASTVRRLMMQNTAITVAASASVLLISTWLARLYKVEHATLWPLLCWVSVYAVLMAINGVYERWFFCVQHQVHWLGLSVASSVLQVGVTYLALPHSVSGVAQGMAAGALAHCLLASIWVLGIHANERRA